MTYPSKQEELKKLLAPAAWDSKLREKFWAMPLRDPFLIHEFDASGLRNLSQYEAWRVRTIPRYCERIAPHKFILPPDERLFQRQRLPGVFKRIVKDVCDSNSGSGLNSPAVSSTPAGLSVQRLTHVMSQASCVLLAVHADRTCDLELSPEFMMNWEAQPKQRYGLPGLVQVMPRQPGLTLPTGEPN